MLLEFVVIVAVALAVAVAANVNFIIRFIPSFSKATQMSAANIVNPHHVTARRLLGARVLMICRQRTFRLPASCHHVHMYTSTCLYECRGVL